jgi:hypothetical protein
MKVPMRWNGNNSVDSWISLFKTDKLLDSEHICFMLLAAWLG